VWRAAGVGLAPAAFTNGGGSRLFVKPSVPAPLPKAAEADACACAAAASKARARLACSAGLSKPCTVAVSGVCGVGGRHW